MPGENMVCEVVQSHMICVVDEYTIIVYYNIDEEKIPRHREINEALANAILKKWGL